MASVLKVDKLDPQSGTALEIGTSGDTITVPSGATFTVSGTMNASSITAGTIATARLGSGTASSSTVLYGDQTYKAEPGGGLVLQVLNFLTDTETVVTTDTYTDTGLTLDITPASTSNKVLVFADCCGVGKQTNTTKARLKLLRDTTVIVDDFAKEAGSDNTTGPNKIGSVSTTYLDSPSSTSALTYKVQLMSADDNALAQMGASGAKSTITLMEISG